MADCKVLRVSADEKPGPPGNSRRWRQFGIAASLDYQLHEVGRVTGGVVVHPLPRRSRAAPLPGYGYSLPARRCWFRRIQQPLCSNARSRIEAAIALARAR